MREDKLFISEENENLKDKVVIEPEVKDVILGTGGGLLLSGRGKVISVEANVKNIKPGDIVCFEEDAGQEAMVFGKILKILKESEEIGRAHV